MTVVLTAMNRFLNETDGSQTAFLDGNQPDRLCAPMREHIERRGGEVRTGAPVREFRLHEDGSVAAVVLRDGTEVVADEYVSAMPVDVFKRLVPKAWATQPFFRQIDELEGIPVINLQLWFDRKLSTLDGLCFSRSPLLSVYADMSTCCKEYADPDKSMLELVFAPCSPAAGAKENWIGKPDEAIVEATMAELARLFPTEIGPGAPGGGAVLTKSTVVKVPRSVYAAVPGRNRYRPSQVTPVANFTLAGDWTAQKFLGSMEGAILGGKLAAEVVADRARGAPAPSVKPVEPHVVEAAKTHVARDPPGVASASPIAFGGGMILGSESP
jgi:15-cis-phytoene desaturase